MKSIANNQYWDQHWQNVKVNQKTNRHPLNDWLDKQVPKINNGRCFEIGCYPGKFLPDLGKKGYELNGIDLSTDIVEMKNFFQSQGYKVGEFINQDFLKHKTDERFDLVCSFGFIEHFDDWQEVVNKHFEITKDKGLCIIEVPNLSSPIYYLLYKILEPNVLKNHNLKAMSLKNITTYISSCDHKVDCAQYVGDFYFRFVTKTGKKYQSIEKFLNSLKGFMNLFPKSLSARYIGVIAKKQIS